MSKYRWLAGAILALAVAAVIAATLLLQRSQPTHVAAPVRKDALEVTLTGHQFWWEITYPQLGIDTASELHLPVGDPGKPIAVRFTLTSADTTYSLQIPTYKIYATADPNAPQSIWIEPAAIATDVSQCTGDCEGPKGRMLLHITTETSADFRTWAAHQKESPSAISEKMPGRTIFEHSACVTCHTLAGTIAAGRFGPDLTHFASRTTLAGGTLPNTAANLRAFLNDPTQLKLGCVMPPAHLAPHDLDEVTAYLTSLK